MEQVTDGFWRLRSGTPQMRAMAERLACGAQARAAELDGAIAERPRTGASTGSPRWTGRSCAWGPTS